MSDLVAVLAYGGPHGGTIVQTAPGERHHWAPRTHAVDTYVAPGQPVPESPMFRYCLVYAADGGIAFVPADDDDLRQAFLSASGEPGDTETDTLAAEIKRRGLPL